MNVWSVRTHKNIIRSFTLYNWYVTQPLTLIPFLRLQKLGISFTAPFRLAAVSEPMA